MKCNCDPHIQYCDICFPPEKRKAIVKPRNGKPLTDAEIAALWDGHVVPVFGKNGINPIVFARAIEQAHGITE